MLKINEQLTIPADEITLRFDVAGSRSLEERDRDRLLSALATRISNDGVLQISAHASRSQAANKADAIERFRQLVADALRPQRERKATRPSRGERRRRLEGKRHRAEVKRTRGKVRYLDE